MDDLKPARRKAFLGAGAVVGAALSSVLFAMPAGAAAPPSSVALTTSVSPRSTADGGLVVSARAAGSSTLPFNNFFVPGCYDKNAC